MMANRTIVSYQFNLTNMKQSYEKNMLNGKAKYTTKHLSPMEKSPWYDSFQELLPFVISLLEAMRFEAFGILVVANNVYGQWLFENYSKENFLNSKSMNFDRSKRI